MAREGAGVSLNPAHLITNRVYGRSRIGACAHERGWCVCVIGDEKVCDMLAQEEVWLPFPTVTGAIDHGSSAISRNLSL